MQNLQRKSFWMVLVLLLLGVITAPSVSAQQNKQVPLTDQDIDRAIDRIKDYLWKAQHQSGAWFGSHHSGPADTDQNRNAWGPTSIAVLSLIVAGESPQRPEIAKALKILSENDIEGTYAYAMRTHVWSYLPDRYMPLLSQSRDTLMNSLSPVNGVHQANFNYYVYGSDRFPGNPRIDNSTTQYGILSLWQCRKRGLDVGRGFWEAVGDGFLKMQKADGGWSYANQPNTTQTMTCAGLTCMLVAQQELFRRENNANQKFQESINKGLAYLDRNFDPNDMGNHGGGGYAYYGYERVALACGRKYFGTGNKQYDWFETIARKIIARNGNYGNSIHDAAFALMFLTRGRVPVWINKLEVDTTRWNNRPNDVYFLNEYISNYREHEVNWQVVNLDTMPARDWMAAPLTWYSSDDAFQLTDGQRNKLKRYIDYGGTVIFNPEKGDTGFKAAVRDLAAQMYPGLEFETLDPEHPMAQLLVGGELRRKPAVQVLSNGARVLMIMPDDDWGMNFQADQNPDPNDPRQMHWRYITNIYGVATDRGELRPRLYNPIVSRNTQRSRVGTIKVMIPTFEGQPLPESDVYAAMKNYMFNETGYQIVVEQRPLAQLVESNPSLLHMIGSDEVSLSQADRQAIDGYVKAGGTILIENLGGRGDFVTSVQTGLATVLVGVDNRLKTEAVILGSETMPAGYKNNSTVTYRRMTLEGIDPGRFPLLRGYKIGDRVPVLVSKQDISLGMLGVRQYGINGYSVDSARDLMVNILLEAKQAHPGSETAARP
ncbi:MAG: DUF4159 domain-containing protein [Planctomycetota bacterium]